MKVKLKYIHCFDSLEKEIIAGDFLDVQKDPIHRTVYKKEDGQLYFTPYGKEDKVSSYFKNDLAKKDQTIDNSNLHLPHSPHNSLNRKHPSHTQSR